MVSVAGARCGKVVRFVPGIVAASPSTCQQRDNTVGRATLATDESRWPKNKPSKTDNTAH
jgi:hypothetical protein